MCCMQLPKRRQGLHASKVVFNPHVAQVAQRTLCPGRTRVRAKAFAKDLVALAPFDPHVMQLMWHLVSFRRVWRHNLCTGVSDTASCDRFVVQPRSWMNRLNLYTLCSLRQ